MGAHRPLGATWDGQGTNFAVFTENGDSVELCLFDTDGGETRVEMVDHTAHTHHLYLPGVGPGTAYGYRVHGRWEPAEGFRFNPNKLLTDPYAKAIDGEVDWAGPVWGHNSSRPAHPDQGDSALFVPRSVVVDASFDWDDDKPPNHDWHDTVIYETHVKGISQTHPDVPDALRGTYAGMATKPVVDHLLSLGVTAVELLPVHHSVPESFLKPLGLTNYWGYQTLGFFAPHAAYSASGSKGQQVTEFKQLVKTFHQAGIEVLLDVVYNHTTEGGANGPTLSLRGLDNPAYYCLDPADRGLYTDFTGTGNSINATHPAALALIMDSLRYWVQEMRVDGFRFDLASTLARGEDHSVSKHSAFFNMVHQDPVVSSVKLIAEPWDVGPGGYQVGNFPSAWSEWNDQYRDDVRSFWKADNRSLGSFASRFAGSSDVFGHDRRMPCAGINFLTAHDGFTLADVVSYNDRHNEANGEDNRDGHGHNVSWNGGVEGPTDDLDIIENRRRRVESMLVTLMLSQGVPMISGGDEIGRTQHGNNNAYAQDNEMSWHDWSCVNDQTLKLVRELSRFRAQHPVFRRRRFFHGRVEEDLELVDIGWFRPDGLAMEAKDWGSEQTGPVAVFVNGRALADRWARREPVNDNSFFVLFNSGRRSVKFTIPKALEGDRWTIRFDTAGETVDSATHEPQCLQYLKVGGRGVAVLERERI